MFEFRTEILSLIVFTGAVFCILYLLIAVRSLFVFFFFLNVPLFFVSNNLFNRKSQGKRRIHKIQNLWECRRNPGTTVGIPAIQWESREYGGSLMHTVGIPGIR